MASLPSTNVSVFATNVFSALGALVSRVYACIGMAAGCTLQVHGLGRPTDGPTMSSVRCPDGPTMVLR